MAAKNNPQRKLSSQEQSNAMQAIKKGQQMAGHNPSRDDLRRAKRILDGRITFDQAVKELDAKFRK